MKSLVYIHIILKMVYNTWQQLEMHILLLGQMKRSSLEAHYWENIQHESNSFIIHCYNRITFTGDDSNRKCSF